MGGCNQDPPSPTALHPCFVVLWSTRLHEISSESAALLQGSGPTPAPYMQSTRIPCTSVITCTSVLSRRSIFTSFHCQSTGVCGTLHGWLKGSLHLLGQQIIPASVPSARACTEFRRTPGPVELLRPVAECCRHSLLQRGVAKSIEIQEAALTKGCPLEDGCAIIHSLRD